MEYTEKKVKYNMIRVLKKKQKHTAPMKGHTCADSTSCKVQETLPALHEAMMPIERCVQLLRKCGVEKDREQGLLLHAYMHKMKLEDHKLLGTRLVSMLVDIGSLSEAQQVFDRLLHRNERSWNALIVGYAKYGKPQHSITLYQEMLKDDSIHPDTRTFVALLKACATIRDLKSGLKLHADVARLGLVEENLFVGSTLVDMYAKCGLLGNAQQVFDLLPRRNIVSWTALISGFAEHGHGEKALELLEEMQLDGISPNAVTLVCGLKACCSIGATDKGREIHEEVERRGLLENDPLIGNALVTMYSKCGSLTTAQEVFENLPSRDIVSWTTLITGYAERGHDEEALNCFEQMQCEGVPLDAVMFVRGLKVCCNTRALDMGQEIHAEIERWGLLDRSLVVHNTLIDMYAKFGLLAKAQEVFDRLPVRNVFTWATLIAGYAEHGIGEKALHCFERMQVAGVVPDSVTYVCCLKACGLVGAAETGREIHAEVERQGLLKSNIVVGNTLIDMYAKWGLVRKARQVFDRLPVRNVVSWNALIAGYADHEHGEDVLKCIEKMQLEGISPNIITLVCGLKACGSIGATIKGRELHADIERLGLLERDDIIGNILVDMYAKCGLLVVAQEVFDNLRARDVVSWNSLMAGYVHLGESKSVPDIFDRMLGDSMRPDLVTFVIVLNACSRIGLFNKSQMYFEAMSKDYGIVSTLKHHAGIVDLFCRAGQLDKALAIVRKMPQSPNLVIWRTILGACRSSGNLEFGKEAFEHAVCLDQKDSSPYVLMSQIYAGADAHEEVNQVGAIGLLKQK